MLLMALSDMNKRHRPWMDRILHQHPMGVSRCSSRKQVCAVDLALVLLHFDYLLWTVLGWYSIGVLPSFSSTQ